MRRNAPTDFRTQEYWDHRVKTARNRDDMIFIDGRRDRYWERVREILDMTHWQMADVLDIACGFGKFAKEFPRNRYLGVDFSEEMLKIARAENPEHTFEQQDVGVWIPPRTFDIIFEVNSLKSLGMTADAFHEKFKPYAKLAVASLEADDFRITQLYP